MGALSRVCLQGFLSPHSVDESNGELQGRIGQSLQKVPVAFQKFLSNYCSFFMGTKYRSLDFSLHSTVFKKVGFKVLSISPELQNK